MCESPGAACGQEILVRRLCLTGVSSLSHLHDFSVSLRLSKRLSAVTVLSLVSQVRLSDASHIPSLSARRVSLSLTAGLRRHSPERSESSHFLL